MQSKSSLPILFACTDILPSFIELDPFSSVRELAQFFNSTLVELKCQDKNSGVENLMRYRQGAIWIVPLTESVLSNLNNDFELPSATYELDNRTRALNRLKWSRNGHEIAVGDDHGQISIFELNENFLRSSPDETKKFLRTKKNYFF